MECQDRTVFPAAHLAVIGKDDGTKIVANLRTSLVVTLNPMAAAIWDALGEGSGVADIVDLLSELDGAPPPHALRDTVLELLGRLEADGFLTR